jgi:hypothetical protein
MCDLGHADSPDVLEHSHGDNRRHYVVSRAL